MSLRNLSTRPSFSSGRVGKWEEIGCNLRKLKSKDEPRLVGLVPRSVF